MNLSKPQRLVYDMEKFAGGPIAVICGSILFDGKKEAVELQRAANELYRLNDALRLQITEASGTVTQEVLPYSEREIPVLRFSEKAALDIYAETEAKTPMDLHGNLCELCVVLLPGQYGILGKLHHLVSDAWTLAFLGFQFHSLVKGESVQAYSYTDYLEKEQSYFSSVRAEKDRAFFLEQFKRCEELTYLSDRHSDAYTAERKRFTIEQADAKAILDYCSAKGVSVFSLFTAVLATYINRTNMNKEQFYIGTAVLNRTGLKEKNTAGMFINTVPVLIELKNTSGFAENLDAVDQSLLSVLRHQKYHYGELLSALRKEYSFGEKLFDVILSYQNATVPGEGETTWYSNGMQTESLQIHIDDRDNEGVFHIQYDYLTELFSEHEIDLLHSHLTNLLFSAIRDDCKRLYELDLLTMEERQKLFYEFNDTAADYPKDKCVHTLFEEQAERTPNKVAVIACDRTLTYRELNEEANRIAHSLIERGVSVGDIVAFALPRRSYLISAIFGILKAGAAYLPIDPNHPLDRNEFMLSDSNAKLLITDSMIAELRNNNSNQSPGIELSGDRLCYCIYTSGSTGRPKGVKIQHFNLVNFCQVNDKNLHGVALNNGNELLSMFNCCFDAFGVDYAWSLLNGKTTLLVANSDIGNPFKISELITKYGIDIIHTTPAILNMLSRSEKFKKALSQVKTVLVGAEVFGEALFQTLEENTNATILNGYGPSETTIGVSFSNIRQNGMTIGKPIANTQVYILDKQLHLVPIGVTGELCIAGDGVGAGYLNRPELTAERFIDNPFGEGKLYKTGDLAFWREDGNLVYVGRNDFQVKIRGLRIELGEIENAMNAFDGVSQAVATTQIDAHGHQYLVGHYVANRAIDEARLRTFIGNRLPKYMVPHYFCRIDEMPMTTSGKINRKALPPVVLSERNDYVAPQTEIQEKLCDTAAKVLGVDRIGITDDFFELGGDSLRAIELLSMMQDIGIRFELQSLYESPTMQALATVIENGRQEQTAYSAAQFDRYHALLSQNQVRNLAPEKQPLGTVLLTGATGYLGAHVLNELLSAGCKKVYCLVRHDVNRLKKTLQYYFGGRYDSESRIIPVVSDLSDILKVSLQDKLDLIIHTAATVKHYGDYEVFHQVNTVGTENIAAFARRHGARLLHISTVSVSGADIMGDASARSSTEKDFSETDLFIGQKLENAYIRSKFLAECAVLDAALEGLPVSIIRVGNLTNRRSDGLFQPNYETNAFLNRLKAILELGCFPDNLMDLYAEFSPVDETASAIVRIAEHFTPQRTVYHVYNYRHLYFRDMLPMLRELGFPMGIVSADGFAEHLRCFAAPSVRQALANDLDENGKLALDPNIRIHCDSTVSHLEQFGFRWQPVDFAYLKQYVDYFRKIGYLI